MSRVRWGEESWEDLTGLGKGNNRPLRKERQGRRRRAGEWTGDSQEGCGRHAGAQSESFKRNMARLVLRPVVPETA